MKAAIIQDSDFPALSDKWEWLVKSNPASGFMQSRTWSQFKKREKLTPVHVGLFDKDQLVGGSIFYAADSSKGAGIMVAPDGPVLPWHDELRSMAGLRSIISCAESYAHQNGHIALRIQPRLNPPALADMYEFGRSPVDLTPKETLFIDIGQPAEKLLMQFKHKTRYNLRLSQRHGVRVFESRASESIRTFHNILLEAASRDGFHVEPFSFFQSLIETLSCDNTAQLFFAEHEGDILGAALIVTYGNRATYLYGGITNKKRNMMAGYALQWIAMMAAKAAGCTSYDFYGFDQFGAPGHAYARFSRFKRGFGGTPVRYIGAQDYFFLDTLADAVVKAVSEVKWDETVFPVGGLQYVNF